MLRGGEKRGAVGHTASRVGVLAFGSFSPFDAAKDSTLVTHI